MSRSKVIIKSTNRRRGTVPLPQVRKAIADVLAERAERGETRSKTKNSASGKAN